MWLKICTFLLLFRRNGSFVENDVNKQLEWFNFKCFLQCFVNFLDNEYFVFKNNLISHADFPTVIFQHFGWQNQTKQQLKTNIYFCVHYSF